MADDIVQELNDWAYIIDKTHGKAHVVFISSDLFKDAANEIIKIQSALLLMAGTLSTSAEWSHMHPEEILDMYLQKAAPEWRCPECGGTIKEPTHNEDCAFWIGG